MTFIGYELGTKGYKFMTENNTIFLGGKAIFDETKFPRCKKHQGDSDLGSIPDLSQNHDHNADHGDNESEIPPSNEDSDSQLPHPFEDDDEPKGAPSPPPLPKEPSPPHDGPSEPRPTVQFDERQWRTHDEVDKRFGERRKSLRERNLPRHLDKHPVNSEREND